MRKIATTAMLLLAACSGGENVADAQRAVANFHAQLNSGNYQRIYVSSDGGLKRATSEAEMIKLLAAVHAKLGAFKGGTQSAWRVNYNTAGNNTVIQFDSNFEKGKATETFTFVGEPDAPRLFAYNIHSPALITG
jgi:hypothetical protein